MKRIQRLASTPVSESWQVEEKGRLAVLRTDRPAAARLGLDRHIEIRVLGAAAVAGVGPRLLAAEPCAGLLLTGWLPGRPWQAVDLQEPRNLVDAAALLRRVHGLNPDVPALDVEAAIRRYASVAVAGCGSAEAVSLAIEARSRLAAIRSAGITHCLCHNDPTPANFIASAQTLHLIDWEYARVNDPWFDLAVLASEAALSPQASLALLTGYLGQSPGERDSMHLCSWRAFYECLAALWDLALCGETTPGKQVLT